MLGSWMLAAITTVGTIGIAAAAFTIINQYDIRRYQRMRRM